MENDHEKDLPLMSNLKDIHVGHYILDLTCDMPAKIFRGSITLILRPLIKPHHLKRTHTEFITDICGEEGDEDGNFSRKNTQLNFQPIFDSCSNEELDPDLQNYASNDMLKQTSHNISSAQQHSSYSHGETHSLQLFYIQGETHSQQPFNSQGETHSQNKGNIYQDHSYDLKSNVSKHESESEELHHGDGKIIEKLPPTSPSTCGNEPIIAQVDGQETGAGTYNTSFQFVLDCCDIDIKSVYEVQLTQSQLMQSQLTQSQHQNLLCNPDLSLREPKMYNDLCMQYHLDGSISPLCFKTERWCVKIWKDGVTHSEGFPRIVKIFYETSPHGLSLKWTKDIFSGTIMQPHTCRSTQSAVKDAGWGTCQPIPQPCVFTPGSWINNRSFFPCQDVPGSMATWQARIHVPDSMVVLMTGDEGGLVTPEGDGQSVHYFQTSMLLPSSTLAIAVGHWEHVVITPVLEYASSSTYVPDFCCHNGKPCTIRFSPYHVIPCKLYAPQSVLKQAEAQFKTYIPKCFEAAYKMLGPHPFRRMDILIVPPGFASLGMASPNLMYLSQSLLCEDGSMNIRFAHEVCHSWFGLVIGAKDWTEEWLSEGFATYMEDFIHARVMEWTEEEQNNHLEMRALLRYRTLHAEMEVTEDDLQTLRPIQGNEVRNSKEDVSFVKNGLNIDKGFTQVHYLKGYFLLNHLANQVGTTGFNKMMKSYVLQFHGQLVSSQDFLEFVFSMLPELAEKGFTIATIFRDWLDNPGMPEPLVGYQLRESNSLLSTSFAEVEKWRNVNEKFMSTKRKRRGTADQYMDSEFKKMTTDQIVLILELLLELNKMSSKTLKKLQEIYCLHNQNADIKHRWCELVVKHEYVPGYGVLRDFLIRHQAMGVYLYGECIISRSKKLSRLAQHCYDLTKEDMEEGARKIVHEMLTGKPAGPLS